MNPNDKTAFLVYSWATFGLGCVEGAALVGGMLAEIVGSVTIAGMCGPIGIGMYTFLNLSGMISVLSLRTAC